MTRELPDGGKPWFFRRPEPPGHTLVPCSIEGWAVTLGFAATSLAGTLLFVLRARHDITASWIFAVVLGAATLLFVSFAWRKSVPDQGRERDDGVA